VDQVVVEQDKDVLLILVVLVIRLLQILHKVLLEEQVNQEVNFMVAVAVELRLLVLLVQMLQVVHPLVEELEEQVHQIQF
tara:strand:+ start:323 stop:562 length:240 start_codon:yes stop_codon:yes gene_type:complete